MLSLSEQIDAVLEADPGDGERVPALMNVWRTMAPERQERFVRALATRLIEEVEERERTEEAAARPPTTHEIKSRRWAIEQAIQLRRGRKGHTMMCNVINAAEELEAYVHGPSHADPTGHDQPARAREE